MAITRPTEEDEWNPAGPLQIVVTIGGIGRTIQISTAELKSRVIPSMRYVNVVSPWWVGDDETGYMHIPTDPEMIQAWANAIIRDLLRTVEVHEDSKRKPTPLVAHDEKPTLLVPPT